MSADLPPGYKAATIPDYVIAPNGAWFPRDSLAQREADLTQVPADGFRLEPLDWDRIRAEGLPEIRYLSEPYLPAGGRVWAFGAAESGKSLWALAVASDLTRQGLDVVVISQENPLSEDLRRLDRLQPDPAHLRFFHGQGLDLVLAEHRAALLEASRGTAFVVLDTLSACWSGDENDNRAIAAFDRDLLMPLVQETGATFLILDHTGHPQAFVARHGVHAGRGASSKSQKADVVLEFRATGASEFSIDHAKARMGGVKVARATFRVVDTEGNGLAVERVEASDDGKVRAMADRMAEAIGQAGEITSGALRRLIGGHKELQSQAMGLLEAEIPPRVVVGSERVDTGSGRQRAKVWRPSPGRPQAVPDDLGDEAEAVPSRALIGGPGRPGRPLPDDTSPSLAAAVALILHELPGTEVMADD